LASQLAVVIENTRLFAQLQRKNQLLQRAIQIHEELTQMVLHGQDLQSITSTLAQLLGRPVQVTDQCLRPVAFGCPCGSNGGPQEAVEISLEKLTCDSDTQDFLKRLRREQRPLPFPKPKEYGLPEYSLLVPVRVGGETLGYLVVFAANQDIGEMDLMAMEHGATVVALKFMQEKVAYEVEERIRGRFIEDLIYRRWGDEREVLEKARYLGCDPHYVYQVLVIQVSSDKSCYSGESSDKEFFRPRCDLSGIVQSEMSLWGYRAVTTGVNPLVVVVDAGFGGKEQSLPQLVEDLGQRIKKALGFREVLVCIGSPVKGITKLHYSYRDAHTLLQVANRFGLRDGVIGYKSLGVLRILLQIENPQVLQEYVDEILGPLLAYDRDKKGRLVSTLKAFVQSNFNCHQTAQRLFIHLNTLKYRLQRIRDVSGLDLDDPEERLNICIAIKILDLLNQSPTESLEVV
jgi:purine catabolism regulator